MKLFIDSDSLFSIQSLELSLQQKLLEEFENSFYIEDSTNFLNYYSENEITVLPFISFPNANRDLTAEWGNIFSYKVHQESYITVLEISFKRINPNSAIAFPNVILIKKPLKS